MLDSTGAFLEDVPISSGKQWTADDHIGWTVASYDGSKVFFVTTESNGIYSVEVDVPHTVSRLRLSAGHNRWQSSGQGSSVLLRCGSPAAFEDPQFPKRIVVRRRWSTSPRCPRRSRAWR